MTETIKFRFAGDEVIPVAQTELIITGLDGDYYCCGFEASLYSDAGETLATAATGSLSVYYACGNPPYNWRAFGGGLDIPAGKINSDDFVSPVHEGVMSAIKVTTNSLAGCTHFSARVNRLCKN